MTENPDVTSFFHEDTNTISYVVTDPETSVCAIIDSVLDYDAASGRTSTAFADQIVDHVLDHDRSVAWILETHAHADHLSGAVYLKHRLGGQIAIGHPITGVQKTFADIFNLGDEFPVDGSQFDHLFKADETFQIGSMTVRVLSVPGHTAACSAYVVGDCVFVGDTLFMPDYGTARCDFPGGDAGRLYDSVQSLYALPDATRMFLCHDYLPPGRTTYLWETTVGAQKRNNIHIDETVTKAAFTTIRNERDVNLGLPRLIIPSIQVNIRGGQLPPPEDNGVSYLKVPVDQL